MSDICFLARASINIFDKIIYFGFSYCHKLNRSQILFAKSQLWILILLGFSEKPSVFLGLLLFSMLYQPLATVLHLILNAVSRRFEFEADQYAIDLGMVDLRTSLVQIHLENLGNLNPDPLYSMIRFSHPPLVLRLKAMNKAIEARQRKAQ